MKFSDEYELTEYYQVQSTIDYITKGKNKLSAGSYGDGIFSILDIDTSVNIIKSWNWKFNKRFIPIVATAFGDLFLYCVANQYVYYFQPQYNTNDMITKNIDELFGIINELFQDTGKTISISKGNNSTLIFHQNENTLHLEQLSSGEKQLLLILLKVFLQEKKPAIIFMDEPEISLHIRWQREIIDRIRQINPSCQIIIATHSPSMFGAGWGDKVVYMEDIIK